MDVAKSEPDLTAAFLVPLLGILAASMLSRAASGPFEWLYPIRVVAALGALWVFRGCYRDLDWRSGWSAVWVGVAVFCIWIAADRLTSAAVTIPSALVSTPGLIRNAWIAFRILGGVLTVPVTEELAFRGYLLRRFTHEDFESVAFQSVAFRSTTWIAILGSSLVFGLMHGGRWWLGWIAGTLYALLIRRTGRMGDAVMAHAVTNALIAIAVLGFGQWQLW